MAAGESADVVDHTVLMQHCWLILHPTCWLRHRVMVWPHWVVLDVLLLPVVPFTSSHSNLYKRWSPVEASEVTVTPNCLAKLRLWVLFSLNQYQYGRLAHFTWSNLGVLVSVDE